MPLDVLGSLPPFAALSSQVLPEGTSQMASGGVQWLGVRRGVTAHATAVTTAVAVAASTTIVGGFSMVSSTDRRHWCALTAPPASSPDPRATSRGASPNPDGRALPMLYSASWWHATDLFAREVRSGLLEAGDWSC